MPAQADRPAPAFTQGLLSDHGSFRFPSHPGRVTVVNFWASWCTACRSETPELDELWKSYRRDGVTFVGVDYNDRRDAALSFARSRHLAYPLVFDPDGDVGNAFGIVGLPTTFIVDPAGHIRYVISGKLRVASFTTALGSVLEARTLGVGAPDALPGPSGSMRAQAEPGRSCRTYFATMRASALRPLFMDTGIAFRTRPCGSMM